MKMVLTEKAPPRYGMAGAEVDITNNCVRFFREQGWAIPEAEVKKADEDAATEALRDEYERLTGKSADSRWKTETLHRKVEEERKTYLRRDMRAEDD